MKETAEDKFLAEKFLRTVPIFTALPEQYMKNLVQNIRIQHFKKDTTIFYQSDTSNDLYIVLSGKIKASIFNEEGEELVLAIFEAGSFFGEMGLIDGADRSATLIADEDSMLSVLERRQFLELIKQDVLIAIELLIILADRIRTSNRMVGSLAFLDVNERLEKLLLQLALKDGKQNKNGLYKIKKIQQSEMAAKVGASRATVSKALKVLTFKKILTKSEGHFFIKPDLTKLISEF